MAPEVAPPQSETPDQVINRIAKDVTSGNINPDRLILDADFLLQKAGEQGREKVQPFLQEAVRRAPEGVMQRALISRLVGLYDQDQQTHNQGNIIRRHIQLGTDLGVSGKPEGQRFLDALKEKYCSIIPGNYTWRAADADYPVEVTGIIGIGDDGQLYAAVEGSLTGISADQLIPVPPAEEPVVAVTPATTEPAARPEAPETSGPSSTTETPASTGSVPVPVTEPAKEPQEEKKPVVLSPEMAQLVNRLARALLKGEQTEIDELIAEIARSKDLGEDGLDISQVLAISEAVANEITQQRTSSKPAFTASLPLEIQTQFQTWWEQRTQAFADRDYDSVYRLQEELIPILNTTLPESAKILTTADYDKYRVPTFHLFNFLPEIVSPGSRWMGWPGNPYYIDCLRQLTARTSPVLNQALENYLQAYQQQQLYKSSLIGKENETKDLSQEERVNEQSRNSYRTLRDQWENTLSTDPELVARVQQAAESLTAFGRFRPLEEHLKKDQTVTLDEFLTAFITYGQAQAKKFWAEQQLTRHQNQQLADMADQAGLKLIQPDREIFQAGWKRLLPPQYKPCDFLILEKERPWWEKVIRWVFRDERWVVRR